MEDIVSESAILAGLYQYGQEAYFEVSEVLNVDCFTDKANSAIYQCFDKIFKEGASRIDLPLLMSAANGLGFGWLFDLREELHHLKGILNTNVELSNLRHIASKIRKLEIGRGLSKLTRKTNLEVSKITGEESLDQIQGMVEDPIYEFFNKIESGENQPINLGKESISYIENCEKFPVDIIGLSSGYNEYDLAIGGGLRKQTISLITARKKVCKSMLGLNIALNVAKRKIPVLILDTEMTEKDCLPRALANIAFDLGYKITTNNIENGKYSRIEKNKIYMREVTRQFSEYPLQYINISGKSFSTVSSIIKRWVHRDCKDNPGLVIYDYIKINDSSSLEKNIAEHQALSFLTMAMHNLCVKYNFPFLAFAQLNREGIHDEGQGIIAGSDKILDTVGNFSIIKLKSDLEIADDGIESGNRKLIVVASRHGPGMNQGDYINMMMRGEYAKIIELGTKFNMKILAQRSKDENIENNKQISLGEI